MLHFHLLTGSLGNLSWWAALMDASKGTLWFSPAPLFSVPLGERYFFPPCARHTGHCGLRRALQLLGQRRPHEVKDLRAAGPANHGVLLQPQRQHLCIRLQLRLVKGGTFRACLLFAAALAALLCSFFLSESDSLQGHEYYNPQKKNYIFLRNAAEELKPRNKKW